MIATSPVSVTRPATTMSKTAFSSWLWDGNATHWPSIRATRTPPTGPENGRPESCGGGDADAADRAGERQAGELRGERRGVDREHVVRVVRVERHHGDDDLDLVAQT